MATEDKNAEYVEDVAKYTTADADVVKKVVKHLGIALRNKDSSLVSCSDKSELDRVRENWCKKKLALTDNDADLDQAIADVCKQMSADTTKSRVTFYYLLAEKYGKLASL